MDQFTKQTPDTNENYGIPYDYGNIMHYGANRFLHLQRKKNYAPFLFYYYITQSCSATYNGRPTMVPNDPKYIETLGSPIISFYELLMINQHYGCMSTFRPRK